MSFRPVGTEFLTPGSGSGGGSGSSSTTNISNAPVLVFSLDPDQGDSGQIGPQGLKGVAGTPGIPFFPDYVPEESISLPGPPGISGVAGSPGAAGVSGTSVFVIQGDDPEESISLPGSRGTDGIIGSNGIDGKIAFVVQEPAEESMNFPGTPGVAGTAGSAGAIGLSGPAVFILPDDPEEGMIGPTGAKGATGAAGGGGGSATTVEIDLGATLKWSGTFTITDAAITSTSKVLCWQAPGPYTGKGTRADEAQMQPVQVIATFPATGSALVYWQTPPIYTTVIDAAYRGLPLPTNTKDLAGWIRNTQKRIHKVRGNVKFSYLVFS